MENESWGSHCTQDEANQSAENYLNIVEEYMARIDPDVAFDARLVPETMSAGNQTIVTDDEGNTHGTDDLDYAEGIGDAALIVSILDDFVNYMPDEIGDRPLTKNEITHIIQWGFFRALRRIKKRPTTPHGQKRATP